MIIYILSRLFKNKRKVTKIEEILNKELERAKYIVSRIGTVNFKYINTKENQAHKILENYRKANKILKKILLSRKWEEDIKELEIDYIKDAEFVVKTVKGNEFIVNLENGCYVSNSEEVLDVVNIDEDYMDQLFDPILELFYNLLQKEGKLQ
ncbi:hypothetical protein [Clostridium sp.]|uniref:hypothetical protein n=1 Tax=Clostridium sp. TaxID=1506 RepID=UPI001EC384B3|nr:hypothetical protein [Clostridium sp.]MBS5883801.1 hypothetical protein [Clostridium sp.]